MAAGRHVVVVGASGNVGTSVLDALDADPSVSSVRALARREPRAPTHAKVEWTSADVVHDDLVALLRGADAVVHLAWLFQPTHDPATTWRVNVLGSLRVFDAVAEAGVAALIYGSSVGAYSPGPQDAAVDEDWPTHGWPGAAYTREKAYLERYLDYFEREHPHVRLVRLRPGFLFKPEAACEQRRLFAGPFLPNSLARPEKLPVVPDVPGLNLQLLHTADAAEAYRLALQHPVRGAFNLAAEPVVTPSVLAELFGARRVRLPSWPLRAGLAVLWNSHLVPASPDLFDAVLRLPIMDTTRARAELGWWPRSTAEQALTAFAEGLQRREGGATPPLEAELPGGRVEELKTGVGSRP